MKIILIVMSHGEFPVPKKIVGTPMHRKRCRMISKTVMLGCLMNWKRRSDLNRSGGHLRGNACKGKMPMHISTA